MDNRVELINKATLPEEQEDEARGGILPYVRQATSQPNLTTEHITPTTATTPVKQSGELVRVNAVRVGAEKIDLTGITPGDLEHHTKSSFSFLTGVKGWLRHMASAFGRRVGFDRNRKIEELKNNSQGGNSANGDYERIAA